MTPQQRKEASSSTAEGDKMIADMEEKGTVPLETLNILKSYSKGIYAMMEKTPLEEYEDKPEPSATWTFEHSEYGKITITDEGFKHWRQATEGDCGKIACTR